jgi:hypothetical protein
LSLSYLFTVPTITSGIIAIMPIMMSAESAGRHVLNPDIKSTDVQIDPPTQICVTATGGECVLSPTRVGKRRQATAWPPYATLYAGPWRSTVPGVRPGACNLPLCQFPPSSANFCCARFCQATLLLANHQWRAACELYLAASVAVYDCSRNPGPSLANYASFCQFLPWQ